MADVPEYEMSIHEASAWFNYRYSFWKAGVIVFSYVQIYLRKKKASKNEIMSQQNHRKRNGLMTIKPR